MNRLSLATATVFLLTAGAALAQNPLNTTAPGPTQERQPGQTNNDLPNPGHPVPAPTNGMNRPVTENGTVEGTATESMQRDQTGTSTGSMDNSATTGMNSSSTTGSSATTGMNDTTTGMNDTTGTSSQVGGTSGRLPRTGSEMPLVGLIGLTSLAGFAVLRSRNA